MRSAVTHLGVLVVLLGRRVGRALAEIAREEPLAGAIVVGLAALIVWQTVESRTVAEHPGASAGVAVALVLLAHGARGDETLLRLAGVPYRSLFAIEYVLLVLPVVALLAASSVGPVALAPVGGAIVAAVLPSGGLRTWLTRGARRAQRLPLPRTAFEWIAGLRRALPAAIVYLVAIVAAVGGHLPGVLVLALFTIAWITAGFYFDAAEGWPLVTVFGLGPRTFLRRKVISALTLYGAAALPIALLFAVRHPALWGVLVAALAGAAVVTAGAVTLKYALYQPGRRRPVAGAFGLVVLTIGLVVPPVVLFLVYRLWVQAGQNLGTYLDADD